MRLCNFFKRKKKQKPTVSRHRHSKNYGCVDDVFDDGLDDCYVPSSDVGERSYGGDSSDFGSFDGDD
jgi:hypothetical protein